MEKQHWIRTIDKDEFFFFQIPSWDKYNERLSDASGRWFKMYADSDLDPAVRSLSHLGYRVWHTLLRIRCGSGADHTRMNLRTLADRTLIGHGTHAELARILEKLQQFQLCELQKERKKEREREEARSAPPFSFLFEELPEEARRFIAETYPSEKVMAEWPHIVSDWKLDPDRDNLAAFARFALGWLRKTSKFGWVNDPSPRKENSLAPQEIDKARKLKLAREMAEQVDRELGEANDQI